MLNLSETIDVQHKQCSLADSGLDDRSATIAYNLKSLIDHFLFHTDHEGRRSTPQESTG